MAPTSSERQETDRSLRAERDKTDAELSQSRSSEEKDADAVVHKARERADAVLEAARDRSDRRTTGKATRGESDILQKERAAEDATLAAERRSADETLARERLERKLFFASLLRLERAQTDERLRLERARADAQGMARDEFMGLASHDLRNMLAAILLGIEAIEGQAGDDETGRKLRHATDRLKNTTVHMNRLVGDLTDVASIEQGRLAVKPERRDAAALVHETEEVFQPAARAKGVAFETRIIKEPLLAEFDYERILQVLGNIISNAIKFTATGGKISLRVEQDGAEVRFSVSDTGVGIAQDKLQAVFDRFWQASKGDRRGLGLGLFISRCIVEGHGGRIWAQSEVGRGSTFCFTLPAA